MASKSRGESDNSLSTRNHPQMSLYKAPPMGFSLRHRCALRYNDSTTLVPSGTTPSYNVYSLNGLFDPNISGTGHQPLGFDQLMLVYNHYVVESVRFKIEWGNDSSFTGALCGFSITDDTSITTPIQKRLENPWTKYALVNDRSFPLVQNGRTTTQEYFGRAVKDYEDSELRGTSGSNPTEQYYLIVWSQLLNSGASALNVDINVTIEYFAAFSELRDLAQS